MMNPWVCVQAHVLADREGEVDGVVLGAAVRVGADGGAAVEPVRRAAGPGPRHHHQRRLRRIPARLSLALPLLRHHAPTSNYYYYYYY